MLDMPAENPHPSRPAAAGSRPPARGPGRAADTTAQAEEVVSVAVRLFFSTNRTLYHEPRGLKLQAGLVEAEPGEAALALHLGYSGSGSITVDVIAPGERIPERVALRGGRGLTGAAAWTRVVRIGAAPRVDLCWTVLGQPGDDDPLRVRLDSEFTGTVPDGLTVTTTVGVSLQPVPAERMRT